jgi:hypothetical protein
MRVFAKRAIRRYHISMHPKADGSQCFTLCLRKDVKHAADSQVRVPGVWCDSYSGLDIYGVEMLMKYYVKSFERQPWELWHR